MIRARSRYWKWWICGLLLFASAINYMDRQTLANVATRITRQFALTQEQYGNLEFAFGWAFAAGSLFFGVLADRFPVRWVYPCVLALWSGAGIVTGFSESYTGLLVCRGCLGFFEGGHWPCAVKTTRQLLAPAERSMGNSVLQSGTSMGAILAPLLLRWWLTDDPNSWRFAFQIVGAVGLVWIVAWFALIREQDLKPSNGAFGRSGPPESLRSVILSRRMAVILVVIALINTGWQTLRAWLPKFLQEGRGYSEAQALNFNSLFYLATDAGVFLAGALTLWLHRRGVGVLRSRLVAFGVCAGLSALRVALPYLPKGWSLLGAFLLVGAGALGVFPIYHALTQDLSGPHQGKVTGLASVAAWAFAPPAQKFFGRLIDRTHSFDLGFMLAGVLPLIAWLVLLAFWPQTPEVKVTSDK